MGNLIPLFCLLPLVVAGVLLMVKAGSATTLGVALCTGGLLIGWAAVNQFGFFGNDALQKEIKRTVLGKATRDASKGIFVGFARPAYVGLLDAHEDLGFLF